MNPLQPASLYPEQIERTRRELLAQNVDPETVEASIREVTESEIFLNDQYQVNRRMIKTEIGPMWHLSIKRIDKEPCRDWRDFQEIKNQLCGPECEGVELYPAQSRVVDYANQFHLWVFSNPCNVWPFGWFVDADAGPVSLNISGAKQRPK